MLLTMDPRAIKIREQLEDYARMRSELATAQAHLTKSALQWRTEREAHAAQQRRAALLRVGAVLKSFLDLRVSRMLAAWSSSRSVRRKRYEEILDATHLQLIDPDSTAAEEQRGFRRKGLELFAESPQDAVTPSLMTLAIDTVFRSPTWYSTAPSSGT